MPSPTPGGILAVTLRRARMRPSPPHWRQGSGMTSPKPRQTGHGRAVTTWPRKDRWTDWTSPAPPQVSQVLTPVPSVVPAPRQRSQTLEGQAEPDQRVGAGLDAAAGSAPASAAASAGRAEEGVHDVAEAAEPGERVAAAPAARAAVHRVAAEVDDLALLRVGQHLVGRRDLAELVLRVFRRVDVGVQLPGQLPVRALDVLIARVLGHPEDAVVVPRHRLCFSFCSARLSGRAGSAPRSWRPRAPRRSCRGSPSGSGRPPPCRRAPCPGRIRSRRPRCCASARLHFPHRCAP
jgi:hypothetical protein